MCRHVHCIKFFAPQHEFGIPAFFLAFQHVNDIHFWISWQRAEKPEARGQQTGHQFCMHAVLSLPAAGQQCSCRTHNLQSFAVLGAFQTRTPPAQPLVQQKPVVLLGKLRETHLFPSKRSGLPGSFVAMAIALHVMLREMFWSSRCCRGRADWALGANLGCIAQLKTFRQVKT